MPLSSVHLAFGIIGFLASPRCKRATRVHGLSCIHGTGDDVLCTFGIVHVAALACSLSHVWALFFSMDLLGVTVTCDRDIDMACNAVCNSSSSQGHHRNSQHFFMMQFFQGLVSFALLQQ